MKIGIYLNTQISPQNSLAAQIVDSIEQVKAASYAGFDMICTGEHFLSSPYQMASIFPFLARIAAEANTMHVATAVNLLPLHNPVALAENISTMDAICQGRFILGIGLGYRNEEYQAFGVNPNERLGRMIESLEIIKLLFTKDEIEYAGKYYNIPKTKSSTTTLAKPHPPIWVAANNVNAIKRAASWGYPWLINPHATMKMIKEQMQIYKDVLKATGFPTPKYMPLMRELYISDNYQKAYKESRPYLEGKYAAYTLWGQDKALPGNIRFSIPFKDLATDRFLLGSPENIINQIKHYKTELGVNYPIFRMQWPGMAQEQIMKQIDLMGKYVIPQIK